MSDVYLAEYDVEMKVLLLTQKPKQLQLVAKNGFFMPSEHGNDCTR